MTVRDISICCLELIRQLLKHFLEILKLESPPIFMHTGDRSPSHLKIFELKGIDYCTSRNLCKIYSTSRSEIIPNGEYCRS